MTINYVRDETECKNGTQRSRGLFSTHLILAYEEMLMWVFQNETSDCNSYDILSYLPEWRAKMSVLELGEKVRQELHVVIHV